MPDPGLLDTIKESCCVLLGHPRIIDDKSHGHPWVRNGRGSWRRWRAPVAAYSEHLVECLIGHGTRDCQAGPGGLGPSRWWLAFPPWCKGPPWYEDCSIPYFKALTMQTADHFVGVLFGTRHRGTTTRRRYPQPPLDFAILS